jgi:hypothetical protein
MDFLLTQPAAVLYSIAVLYCVSPHERDFDFWTCYFAIGDANRNLPRGILELTSDPDFADHVERGWRRLAAGGIDLDAALTGGDPWGR